MSTFLFERKNLKLMYLLLYLTTEHYACAFFTIIVHGTTVQTIVAINNIFNT